MLRNYTLVTDDVNLAERSVVGVGVEKKGQREKEEGGGSFGRREREVSGITPGSNCVPGAVEVFF